MSDDGPDYDDPAVEDAWCEAKRRDAAAYLEKQQLAHGRIGEWPAWHVPPVISVWAIESGTTAGAVGWWVICGDLPTDYLSADGAGDPRESVRAFAARWRVAAEAMQAGRDGPLIGIGNSAEERRSLAPLLESRAKLMAKWAERDDVWDDLLNDE